MFRLHKWFLDCVTADGEAVVLYAATLRWGLLRLGYSAMLTQRAGATSSSTRLGRPSTPMLTAHGITFDEPRFAVHGTWSGTRLADERVLWSSPRGEVRWHCHLPRAAVQLRCGDRTLQGLGYVEHLALEVAPWHLPIDELRWGRFHGGDRSLVWIQWAGRHPLRLCLLDGVAVDAGVITDNGMTLPLHGSLDLAAPQVLRSGRLGRTVLAQRLLRWLPLPRSVRAMQETKWLAPGALHTAAQTVTGLALHEVVRWQ